MVSKSRLVAACIFLAVNLVGLAAATVRLVRVVQGETNLATSSSFFGPVGATIFPLAFCFTCTVACGIGGFLWAFGRLNPAQPDAESRTVVGMIVTAVGSLIFGFLHITLYSR